jgi:hypothetical protein
MNISWIVCDTISSTISNHMRVYQDVVAGSSQKKVRTMYQQREKFSSLNSLMTSSGMSLSDGVKTLFQKLTVKIKLFIISYPVSL